MIFISFNRAIIVFLAKTELFDVWTATLERKTSSAISFVVWSLWLSKLWFSTILHKFSYGKYMFFFGENWALWWMDDRTVRQKPFLGNFFERRASFSFSFSFCDLLSFASILLFTSKSQYLWNKIISHYHFQRKRSSITTTNNLINK